MFANRSVHKGNINAIQCKIVQTRGAIHLCELAKNFLEKTIGHNTERWANLGESSPSGLTLTTPSLLPVMMTLLIDHSIICDMATQRICWFLLVAVLMLASSSPFTLHTCRYVPAQVAMSPWKHQNKQSDGSNPSKTFPCGTTLCRFVERSYTSFWFGIFQWIRLPRPNSNRNFAPVSCSCGKLTVSSLMQTAATGAA